MKEISFLAILGAVFGEQVCYYHNGCDLGCFTSDPPWGGTDARPNEKLPEPPGTIDTNFILDTSGYLDQHLNFGQGPIQNILAQQY